MTSGILVAAGRLAHTVPGTADDPRAPAWALGLMAFGVLCLLLFVVTRYNRDR